MPRGIRYSAEQMNAVINECKAGKTQLEVSRKYGISDKTISKWTQKFKGMQIGDIKRAKQLEDENLRLRRIIANLTIDNDALREINAKKW
jgi:putative transposase